MDSKQFAAALELRTAALLGVMLDPSATASLPGAGAALAQAEAASADIGQVASDRLSTQESRQGLRDRGLDVSSRARDELARQGQRSAAPASGSASVVQPPDPGALKPGAFVDTPRPDSSGQSGEQSLSHSAANLQSRSGGASAPNGEAANPAPADTNAAASRHAGIAAGGVQPPASADAGKAAGSGGSVSSVPGVSQAAPGGGAKAAPMMMAGSGSAVPKHGAEGAGSRVIRHEPRSFEAQLQRGLAQVLRQQGGTLSLKLDPVELGAVKVSLTMSHGRVDGSIEAASERARGLLEEHIDTLKSSLERRGITVDRLDVRLAGAAENERQPIARQDAGHGADQQNADAGGDRHSGSFRGEDRHAGDRGGNPGERTHGRLRGAGPTSDDWSEQGSSIEPLGGWLRLDTLA